MNQEKEGEVKDMMKKNQIINNPFPYSDTNKRYHTFSYAMKKEYGQKVAKIPLNAHFTCPNRDGTKSTGGCAFCSSMGSGDSILAAQESLDVQYTTNLMRARQKWPNALGMAYFQSFSNTYAPLKILQKIYTPFYQREDVGALAIATRADCFDETMARWFSFQQKKSGKKTWLEFGLQTIHPSTAKAMNLGYTPDEVKKAIQLCQQYDLKCCVHIINGFPSETKSDMQQTAQFLASLHPDAIKIHMLHLLHNSPLKESFQEKPFPLLSLEQYVQVVVDQLEILPQDIIIERITGDGLAKDLLAPLWTIKKTIVANEIDKEFVKRQSYQGKYA